jgi:hypothetical protein
MSNLELANTSAEVEIAQQNPSIDLAQIVVQSSKLDKLKPQLTLTASYLEFEKVGDSFRGIFLGMSTMNVTDKQTGELKELDCVKFIKDGKVVINGGYVLVEEMKRAGVMIGTPLEVTYVKKEGNTKIYELTLIG